MKPTDICPDCGLPFSEHVITTSPVHVQIDVYAVMARIVAGGNLPDEVDGPADPDRLADEYREHLAVRDPDRHDRLFNAAVLVLQYIEREYKSQTSAMDLPVAGHA